MSEQEPTLCKHCLRSISRRSSDQRWIHQDTRSVWCKDTSTMSVDYAEPREVD